MNAANFVRQSQLSDNTKPDGQNVNWDRTDLTVKTITPEEGINLVAGANIATTGAGTKIGGTSSQKLGFWGVTPVVQPSALTTQLTSITHTAPGTPDYALQNLVQNTGFGFATADEGNTLLSVVLNMQVRLAELETALEASGMVAAN